MLNRIAIIIFLLLNGFSVWAQIDTILWQNCLGTEDGRNWTYAAEKTENGFLFGIELEEDGPGVTDYHGSADAWIVNTDQHGNILWERCYGGSDGDGPHKIIKIDENSYYLLNSSWSHDGDVQNGRAGNFWIVKINSEGNIIWEKSYGGTINGEEIRDAILLPHNGLLMMGRISSNGGDVTTHYGDMDVWLCRIDSCGSILWGKTYGNQGKDNGLKVKLTSNNTILFVGGHELPGGMIDCPDFGYYIYTDVWIVEMDLDGNLLNQWCYGGKYYDMGCDIIELDDGYAIAGSTQSNDRDVSGFHGIPGNYYDDIWVFKIDRFGNLIWQKCLGGTNYEYPIYLTQTLDSGFIIIGNTNSYDGDVTGNHSPDWNEVDIWVVKLSSEGQLLWERCFGSSATDRFWGINSVLKKDDYDYIIGANSEWANGDVTCDLFPDPYDYTADAWIFEIKDCSFYLPSPPVILSGPDTLCTSANPVSSYSIDTVQWATGYEWRIQPDSAGSILSDSVTNQVTWNQTFEGQVTVQSRCFNDCGTSAWSEPHVTQVYTCMGLEEFGESGISFTVQPNPARDQLHVRLNMDSLSASWRNGRFNKDLGLEIYDIFGRQALTPAIPHTGEGVSWTVNVSALPQGIYLVKLRDGQTVRASVKFVVVK